jgi:hypothetical protein
MAASDSLGGQFDFNREIKKQVIPKEHHEAILNALQELSEQGVEFMPHGVAFHKEGKRHIVPTKYTILDAPIGGRSSFSTVVPNESEQHVIAINDPYSRGPKLTHTRWRGDSGNPVPTYEGRKWDEGPAYFDQIAHREETDPSRMRDYLRRHSFVAGEEGYGGPPSPVPANKDPRLKVVVGELGDSEPHRYHYHPGTGAITRRELGENEWH